MVFCDELDSYRQPRHAICSLKARVAELFKELSSSFVSLLAFLGSSLAMESSYP